MKKFSYILLSITWLLTILPLISGFNVAIFIPCFPSHISPHFGIIRELLYQNHSVVCILNRECHDKLNHFHVDFVHNDGFSLESVSKSNDSIQGPMSFFSAVQRVIGTHTTIHQDVLDYFENNKIDVILASVILLSANHIADKFNIPLLIHTYLLGFLLREKCRDCQYIGTVGDTDSSLHGQFATDSSLQDSSLHGQIATRTVRYMDSSLRTVCYGQFATRTVRYMEILLQVLVQSL